MDIIATIPLHRLEISQQEDEAVKGLPDEECNWYWLLKPKPKNLNVGERIYFVENGLITAWCPIMELGYFDFVCEVSGKQWTGYQARLGQNRLFVSPISHPGFQGWHYVSSELHARLDVLRLKPLPNSQLISERQMQKQITAIKKLRVLQVSATGQVDYIQKLISNSRMSGERVLISSPGKRGSEDLSEYLNEFGLKTRYFHSDITWNYRQKIADEFKESVDAVIVVDTLENLLHPPTVVIMSADENCGTRNAASLARLASFARKNVVVCADTLTPAIRSVFKTLE